MLNHNVLYIDGPNTCGKTYAIDKIKEGLLQKNTALRIEVVSIKRFYTDIDPTTLAKIYSYDLQWFDHHEVMYIVGKHRELIDYINERLDSGEVDLMIVDRSIISFMTYNVLISSILYRTRQVNFLDEFNASELMTYIEQEIKPRLSEQNSLYVYLRFSMEEPHIHTQTALKLSVTRLNERGVVDYTIAKIETVVSIMEGLHNRLGDECDGYMPLSPSASVRSFFSNCMATDSYHTDAVVQRLAL